MRQSFWRYAVLLSATVLSACGGGGGEGISSTPVPPSPIKPLPVPPPPPVQPNYDTTEFRSNWGLGHINALTAYGTGATGAGVTVGVVDTGIDANSSEFAGRIHGASRDVTGGGRTVQDEDGHGTAIASIIAGARDDIKSHGVAFNATLLVARADHPGSCASDCGFYDNDIAAGIDLARSNNARAVNISLGGGQFNASLMTAVAGAAAKGTIVVFSAGNDGDANPDGSAQAALSPEAKGLVLVVGSVDQNNAISSFSNRAGNARNHFLVAPGEKIYVPGIEAHAYLVSGTSVAAPHVTGALALLAGAFPNMSSADLIDLIFRTATDLGAPGVDAIYGRGLLNLARAFQPQGRTALAGSAQPVETVSANIALGSAFGDGGQLGTALSSTVVLDMYGRAFTVDLGQTVRPSASTLGLAQRLAHEARRNAGMLRGERAALSFAGGGMQEALVWNRLGMADTHLALARQPGADGWLNFSLAPDARLAFGYGRSAADLLGAVASGRRENVSYLSGSGRVGESFGVAAEPPLSAAVSLPVGRWQLSMAASRADLDRDDRASPLLTAGEARIDTMKTMLHRRMKGGELGLSFGWVGESGSVLGARSTNAFGLGAGARTMTAGANAALDLGPRWSLSAEATAGHTRLEGAEGALLAPDGGIWTSSWRFSLSGAGLWRPGDTFGFMVAQPLRVERALAHLTLPVAYSYDAGVTGQRSARVNLAPGGREIDLEAAYALPLAAGADMAIHGFHRFDAGHGAAGRDDSGLVLRLTVRR